ncbi:hypothetical protein Tco_0590110 [Tanacetum coccineum]
MSRDVITVGSTMRIPLLYRGEYSQWRERFMNYLEEQTDGEAMIHSITHGEQPLLVVAQVKPAILYEYETFKAIEGDQFLDTYLRYVQVINDLKKCGYKKDNCEFNYKFLNNLQPKWKQYGTLMRQTKNLMDINIDVIYNILKQNQGDMNEEIGYKKKAVVVSSNPLALKKYYAKPTNNNLRTTLASTSANKKPEGHFAKDFKKAKVKDYEYYKTKMLLAKKDSDEQVLLAKDQAWMESSSDSDQAISANMVFMAKMKKVLSNSEESLSSAEETIAEVSYYSSNSESDSEYETSYYYNNSTSYGLFVDNDDDQETFHDAVEFSSQNVNENHIVFQKDHNESEVDHNESKDKDHLINNLIAKFN